MRKSLGILAFLSTAPLFCQTAPPLAFEVASVKAAAPQPGGPGGRGGLIRIQGGPGTRDPGRITYTNIPLTLLLTLAYDVKNFQVKAPSWMDSEHYDISAKVPEGATKEQTAVMLQNLITERFQLVLHHETKEMSGYELTIAKTGSKLKESAPEDPAPSQPGPPPPSGPPGPPGLPKRDANGFPQLAGRGLLVLMEMTPKGPVAKLSARSQPLSELIKMLGNQLRSPIADKTGMTAKYDFTLEYAPDMAGMGGPPPPGSAPASGPAATDESGPDVMTAIREQLGLKLDSKKLSVDLLVIDKAEKVPTEN
jgi:uncharacterized protein (TIGR03435 family)